MRSLGEVLRRAAGKMGAGAVGRRVRLERAWRKVVGAQLAEQAEPTGVEGSVLLLRTSGSIWSQEISLRQVDLLDRLNRELGGPRLSSIRCRVGRVEAAPAAGPPEAPAGSPPLPPEEARKVRRLAAEVRDPELAGSLGRLMELSARRRKARLVAGAIPCPGCGRLMSPRGCPQCRAEEEELRRAGLLRVITRKPWVSEEELRADFPGLTRTEHRQLRAQLRSRLHRDIWCELRRLQAGSPLPRALRSSIMDLVMIATGLPPGDLEKRHLRHALGPTLSRAYLEDCAPDLSQPPAQRSPKKREEDSPGPSSSESGFHRTGVPGRGGGGERRPR